MRMLLLSVASAVLVLAGCKGAAEETAPTGSEPIMTIGPENVVVAEITELRSGPPVSGSLEPDRAATVRAEVSGSVLRTEAEEGAQVQRGALLASLDDTAVRDAYLSARSQVRSAESALEVARRNAERAERLFAVGAIPDRDLESAHHDHTNAEGALADARARLASAEKQLDDTQIRAPFSGVVSDRQANAGDVVQVGTALFTIVDPRTLRLEASVPADQIGRLRVGTPVEFTVSGLNRRFTGKFSRINPVVDPNTRQIRIYGGYPQRGPAARRGALRRGASRDRYQAGSGRSVDRGRQPRHHAGASIFSRPAGSRRYR